ncbi:MAG: HD domain-containing protein [Armatimonadetes bacterium]|nr:HD domain-containing protein [Armatimonadota bacterium]
MGRIKRLLTPELLFASAWVGLIVASVAMIAASHFAVSGEFELPWQSTAVPSILVLAAFALHSLHLRRYRAVLLQLAEDSKSKSKQLAELVDSLPECMFFFRHGVGTLVNIRLQQELAVVDESTNWDSLLKWIHPLDRLFFLNTLVRSEDEKRSFSVDIRHEISEGVHRYFECHGSPVFDHEGEFVHLAVFLVEVTERVENQRWIQQQNRELEEALHALSENFEATVTALIKAVDAKDPYTRGHSERVKQYSMMLGEAVNLRDDQMQILEMGALIHDIGKIGVPDEILTKPGALTDEEFAIIKRHPVIGYQMIADIPLFEKCCAIVRDHHEKLNGRGYPNGIAGDEIPTLVRIVTIADIFDALTSTRSYRGSMSLDKALEILGKESDQGALDRDLVNVFSELIIKVGIIPSSDDSLAA